MNHRGGYYFTMCDNTPLYKPKRGCGWWLGMFILLLLWGFILTKIF